MNLRPTAIVFDLDGVLWRSLEAHTAAFRVAFAEQGLSLTLSQCNGVTGMRTPEAIMALLALDSERAELVVKDPGLPRRLTARKRQLAADFLMATGPDPDVPLVLADLRQAGFQLGLATGATRTRTWAFLKKLATPAGFDAVVCGDDISRGKPAPDIYLAVATALEVVSPTACIAVEDSRAGMQAALAAGMAVLPYGQTHDFFSGQLLPPCISLRDLARVLVPLGPRVFHANSAGICESATGTAGPSLRASGR